MGRADGRYQIKVPNHGTKQRYQITVAKQALIRNHTERRVIMSPSQEQQKKWGRDLAAEMGSWPRLQQLAEDVGIAADPAELIPTLVNQDNRRQTAPLAAFFTLIENAMAHHANQADADNRESRVAIESHCVADQS